MLAVKVGLYARVSSEKQAQEKTIESQIAAILEHAEVENVVVDPNLYFIDNGVSGAGLERPGLDILRDKALANEVTNVYVLSPDRLSRKSAHQMLLIEEMRRLGVTFTFVNRHIGDSPEDQMLLQMQGIISEYEREKILERSRRGKLFAAKKGRINVLCGAPYGYHYKKTTDTEDALYIVHPEESRIVKEAFDLYCEKSLSIGEIARVFTKNKYLTRSGKTFWERSVIWGMLRNPAYKGLAGFRKTKRVRRVRKTKLAIESKNPLRSELSSPRDRPKEEWIHIAVPAIVTERAFDVAQQRLKDNIKLSPRNNTKNNYLLSGLLRCATCGYSIYGKAASNSKYKRKYYRCMGQDGNRWPGGRVCKGHPVRVEAIDDLIWNSVKCLLMEPDTIVAEYERRSQLNPDSMLALLEQKETEIRRFSNERLRLIDLFQSGLVHKKEIETKLKSIGTKLEQIAGEKKYLEQQQLEQKKLLTVIKSLDGFSENMRNNLETNSFEEKKKIVRLLVEEVQIDTVSEKINVKHIIPLVPKKCQLRSGSQRTALH
jgi:site-specific DNA recombinase